MADIQGTTQRATPGVRGFDANAIVSAQDAAAFVASGYQFAVRYVRRVTPRSADLSVSELADLLTAGLAVMAVQHVESESSWVPTADKGAQYAQGAADGCAAAGLPPGTTVWLDLEGVDPSVDAADIMAYCKNWYTGVAAAGYEPGLYVGWHCGLTPAQLYALPFEHYWGAYNLDRDQEPAERGVQMKQHAPKAGDKPAGVAFEIDVDTISGDALGGLPTFCIGG